MGLHPIRRIVTVNDATGKSIVQVDGITPHKYAAPGNGPVSYGMWLTEHVPAAAIGVADRFAGHRGIAPPDGGSVFTVVDFPPAESAPELQSRPHPFMHRTRTVDYGIILSGEIEMLLDDSEVHLKAGDVVIQQAANHAWVNRGKEVCRIAFILIDAVEPLT